MRTCKVSDCERPHHAGGYCKAHYNRVQRHGTPELVSMAGQLTLVQRFESKFRKRGADECWVWESTMSRKYGAFGISRTLMVGAHRFSYELYVGPIPPGMYICHRCDNPPCVNPNHLYAGTPADNVRDAVERGGLRKGLRKGMIKDETRRKLSEHSRRRRTEHPESFRRGERAPQAKLTEVQVREIRNLLAAGHFQSEVARRFNVSPTAISEIWNRRKWKHVE